MDSTTRLDGEKRIVNPVLKKILQKDVIYTKKLITFLLNFLPLQSFKRHCQFLEVRNQRVITTLI